MAIFDKDGVLVEGTEGRVLRLEHKYSYWGDGDGTYYWQATVWTDEGPRGMQAGESAWNAYSSQADAKGSAVDATPDVIAAYEAYEQARIEREERERIEREAYELRKGALGYVPQGPRKRKAAGAWGWVIWFGTDRFGNGRCGLKHPETGEVAWVPAYQVEVIPEYGDLIGA